MDWRKIVTAAMVSASLVLSASVPPVLAEAGHAAAAQTPGESSHPLTETVRAKLKAAFSERTPDGTVFGVVIGLESLANKVTRVPDYELRIEAEDGTTYTLDPSLANPRSLQPKGKAELGYLLRLDRIEPLKAVRLDWVEIDEYVYPRKETTLLSLEIEGKVWEAGRPGNGLAVVQRWGEPFRLKDEDGIRIAPISLEKRAAAQGRVYVVTVKAVNESDEKRFVPEFTVAATDGRTIYAGVAAAGDWPSLHPGEAKNLHFAIRTEEDTRLSELFVTTPERFVAAPAPGLPGEPQVYQVGRVRIALPSGEEVAVKPKAYEFGKPIPFEPQNGLIGEDVQVALMELHLHDNPGDGYQTAIAKFKLQNVGERPVPLPHFGAELVNGDGYAYAGNRQQSVAAQLMPGLSHIVSYAFDVPKSEAEESFTLRILDDPAAPYAAAIAAVSAKVQREQEDQVWQLYPFHVKLNHWTVHAYTETVPFVNYSYKMVLDVDIERVEDTVVDDNFSRLKIELADHQGRVLGSESIPFVGVGRLVSGKQTVVFSQIRVEQHQYPLTINFYETIDTPNGEANRLIKTIVQKY